MKYVTKYMHSAKKKKKKNLKCKMNESIQNARGRTHFDRFRHMGLSLLYHPVLEIKNNKRYASLCSANTIKLYELDIRKRKKVHIMQVSLHLVK